MNVGSGTLPAPTLRKDSAAAQVRDFRPKDKEAVLSLFSEILRRSQGQAMAEKWRWLFQDCPSPEKPPFLVTQSHGVVIDVLATFSTPGLWQGKEIPMFCVANSDSAILWTLLGSKDLDIKSYPWFIASRMGPTGSRLKGDTAVLTGLHH